MKKPLCPSSPVALPTVHPEAAGEGRHRQRRVRGVPEALVHIGQDRAALWGGEPRAVPAGLAGDEAEQSAEDGLCHRCASGGWAAVAAFLMKKKN